jgi:uncharacterized repeat protein (TIGR03803 family)
MKKIELSFSGFGKIVCIAVLFCVATAVASLAQNSSLTTLYSFDGNNGRIPNGLLVQGFNGNYYGVTNYGGNSSNCERELGCGTVFELNSNGKFTTLYNFCSQAGCADGNLPDAGLIVGNNGNFYGTTETGGTKNKGTVFEITPAGKLTTLYSFCQVVKNHVCTDGEVPEGVIQTSDGDLYGVTESGGQSAHCSNCGTVFQLTTAGKLTTLHAFCSDVVNSYCADGTNPTNSLVLGSNGMFYGVTATGGLNGGGDIFQIDTAGVLNRIYSFCEQASCPDGDIPQAALIQTINGELAGTTNRGGAYNQGTIFEVTNVGVLTTLYSFCPVMNSNFSCDDGESPTTGVVQQADGTFVGTSGQGGPYTYGTVYQLTESGTFTVLYSFCANGTDCVDGEAPDGLLQATSGSFYGATARGGDGPSECCGTLYTMLPSDGGFPSVQPVPYSGPVGRAVNILGTGLNGSTAVTFNGTTAEFTVVSDSRITATVPAGATTGTIAVTTGAGYTYSSLLPFQVQ